MQYLTHSDQETRAFGKQLTTGTIIPALQGGEIFCIRGDLGAGKTTLVKGLAEGLGITEEITSPTFSLMNIYNITNQKSRIKNLIHIDTYRLKDEKEMFEIGAEDYVGQEDMVTIIEWPEKIPNLLQNKKVINIAIDHLSHSDRRLTIN